MASSSLLAVISANARIELGLGFRARINRKPPQEQYNPNQSAEKGDSGLRRSAARRIILPPYAMDAVVKIKSLSLARCRSAGVFRLRSTRRLVSLSRLKTHPAHRSPARLSPTQPITRSAELPRPARLQSLALRPAASPSRRPASRRKRWCSQRLRPSICSPPPAQSKSPSPPIALHSAILKVPPPPRASSRSRRWPPLPASRSTTSARQLARRRAPSAAPPSLVANPASQGISAARPRLHLRFSRTLVTQDDVPLNDPHRRLDPLAGAARARRSKATSNSCRGGASDLYGSSAIGGVAQPDRRPCPPSTRPSWSRSTDAAEGTYDEQRSRAKQTRPLGHARRRRVFLAPTATSRRRPSSAAPSTLASNVHSQNALVVAEHRPRRPAPPLPLVGSVQRAARTTARRTRSMTHASGAMPPEPIGKSREAALGCSVSTVRPSTSARPSPQSPTIRTPADPDLLLSLR